MLSKQFAQSTDWCRQISVTAGTRLSDIGDRSALEILNILVKCLFTYLKGQKSVICGTDFEIHNVLEKGIFTSSDSNVTY